MKEEFCSTPYFVSQILNCITKLNFINCPTFTNSRKCRQLRYFVRKLDCCGESINGQYFINREHFAPTIEEEDHHELNLGKREH